jgi:serine/threonine protein phosphatase 1
MKTFIIGDIHGAAKALEQCLERSGFNNEKDRLIFLGDVADGWPHVKESIDVLLGIKNLIAIKGNHDDWLLDWMLFGSAPLIWTHQGGKNSIKSYEGESIPQEHIYFLKSQINYYEENNNIFLHGGFNDEHEIKNQSSHEFMWNRSLVQKAKTYKMINQESDLGGYNEIFVGHTTTTNFSDIPIKCCNVWMLDQGAGYEGKLSIMDLETHKFWQSDKVNTLYPGEFGR